MARQPKGGLGEFTKRFRAAFALSPLGSNELEEKIGRPGTGWISKLGQGSPALPDPITCRLLARALKVNELWLMYGDEPMRLEESGVHPPLTEETVHRIVEERMMVPPPRRKRDSGATLRAVGQSDHPPSDRPPPPRRR